MSISSVEIEYENTVLRQCTRDLALTWMSFNFLKDVAYGLGGMVYGLLVSGVAVIVMFAILDRMDASLSVVKTVRSAVCIAFACAIVFLYWQAETKI